MKINKAYRYELKPNLQQRILLAQHAGVARFSYNWGLKQRIELYEKSQKSTNAIEQHRQLNKLKAIEYPWMYDVSKCAPQEALRDLDKAFSHFFRGCKQGKKIGFPKPKKKGIHYSFRLTGTIKVQTKSVQLPRLGIIRVKERTKIKGRILSVTLSRQADRWYASFAVEMEIDPPIPAQGNLIGIDLGLTAFMSTSEGEKISAPKPLKQTLKKLRKLSRQHSRKQPDSQNRKKSAFKLARQHRKIGNQRIDFLHKLSTKLAKTKPVIVIEDLDIKRMLEEKRLSRQIADVSWSRFTQMLGYKTQWYGSKLVKAPRYLATSKICSCCHHQVEMMPLSIREWNCPICRTQHDRDVNAAINVINYYTGSSPGIHACGDTSDEASQKIDTQEND